MPIQELVVGIIVGIALAYLVKRWQAGRKSSSCDRGGCGCGKGPK
ncbi:FeoB-associated Cys-rich membrane protein [Roseibacillus ishigakijimensis]|uniref:FeoB-associated Cys-rich membrane protein n=1 Tax=Roseibacillus ishigakijimensis TaxID=454146 RepID=A0A934VMU8_9BACT|nr:FeoB-associated Cys-rich membrane protein [Roseibacillus ishigakijimensis]MBK1834647.1 FeoB-associated Cys-rich membrane protein [Roseibacillus ishigakijimensis]